MGPAHGEQRTPGIVNRRGRPIVSGDRHCLVCQQNHPDTSSVQRHAELLKLLELLAVESKEEGKRPGKIVDLTFYVGGVRMSKIPFGSC